MTAALQLWYLSFSDSSGFLGGCVVHGSDVVSATARANSLGISPGGQVIGMPWPEGEPMTFPMDTLMSREDMESVSPGGKLICDLVTEGIQQRQQEGPQYGIVLDRIHVEPTFNDLRNTANHPRLRSMIEQRKDRICPVPWKFEPESKYHRDHNTLLMCEKLTKWFAEPDGLAPFQLWLRQALEDVFVIDALAVYIYRGKPAPGIEPRAYFRLVDGATIGLIRDEQGSAPPAHIPFCAQMTGDEPVFMCEKDMLYAIRHPREGHVYGWSAIEQIAAREHEAAKLTLKESRDRAIFDTFEPLIGDVAADREWIAEKVIDALVYRVFGETNCRFRWKAD